MLVEQVVVMREPASHLPSGLHVHDCVFAVFAVLALESEPVDLRLQVRRSRPRTADGGERRPYRLAMGNGRQQEPATPSGTQPRRRATPLVDELVRRLSLDGAEVDVHVRSSGAMTLTWRPLGLDHPVVLSLREDDLTHVVESLARDGGADLWPEVGTPAAGLNLLLVHLDEVLMTRDTTDVVRLTRDGLRWPTALRDGYPP